MDSTHPLLVFQDTDTPAQRSARASLADAVQRRERMQRLVDHASKRIREFTVAIRLGAHRDLDTDLDDTLLQFGAEQARRLLAQADAAVHEYLKELRIAQETGGAS